MAILPFLLFCIPSRSALAVLSQYIPEEYLKYYGGLLLLIGLSFLYLYFTNKRLDATEAGGKTWWASLRLLFGLFYLTAAIYAFQGKRKLVLIPLMFDVVFGLLSFIYFHFLQNNNLFKN